MESKITQAELIEMFGEKMPIEAVNLLWNSPGEMTNGQMRAKLRELASTHPTGGDDVERVARAMWEQNCVNSRIIDNGMNLPVWGDPDEHYLWEDWRRLARAAIASMPSRLEERAAIVAWLRSYAQPGPGGDALRISALLIERGDHLSALSESKV